MLDHRVLERFSRDGGTYIRVLVVAVRRESVEQLLAAVRKAGLTPDLIDLSAFAIVRSLYKPADDAAMAMGNEMAPQGEQGEALGPAPLPGTLYCYVGGLTNLAIATGSTCLFNRVLPNGFESMASTLAERRGLTLDHARQWLRHVGMERELASIEGEPEIVSEAREVMVQAARRLADEVRLSLEYYQGTVPDAHRVERMVVAGPAIAIPGFATALGGPSSASWLKCAASATSMSSRAFWTRSTAPSSRWRPASPSTGCPREASQPHSEGAAAARQWRHRGPHRAGRLSPARLPCCRSGRSGGRRPDIQQRQ